MIDQIMIASFLGLSQSCQPIQKRARTEDEFYRDFGSSPIVSFGRWLNSIGAKKQEDRALPARSSIPSSCRSDQAARLARP
ncbi:hypothetical protein EV132_102136 [Rhizobium sullae]|uniref:Uncharacterized protein n=1 Tax=Rhizobium sullae TaxID=50338 RepID=A0A4R3QD89_RHISU|nr:hypothetical protein EV132_102136 [Rhizobium sullae]